MERTEADNEVINIGGAVPVKQAVPVASSEPKPEMNIPATTLKRIIKGYGIEKIRPDALSELDAIFSEVIRNYCNQVVKCMHYREGKICERRDVIFSVDLEQ